MYYCTAKKYKQINSEQGVLAPYQAVLITCSTSRLIVHLGLKMALMSRNAGSGENGRFDKILSVNLMIFMQITLTEMGLTC